MASLGNGQAASEDIDFHQDDSDMFESDSGTSSFNDDDMLRGQWDITSVYYPMFHSDDHV